MDFSLPDRFNALQSLGFGDVMLVPDMAGQDMPDKPASLASRLTGNISLHLPFLAPPETTDAALAIAMAQKGGIAILPDSVSAGKQAEMVRQVKRYQTRIRRDLPLVTPETPLIEALDYTRRFDIRLLPVVEGGTQLLAGFIHLDPQQDYNPELTVSALLSGDDFPTIAHDAPLDDAYALLDNGNASFVAMVDNNHRCTGLVMADDRARIAGFPLATIDMNGALMVGAKVGTTKRDYDRLHSLIDAGVDVLLVYDEHGHNRRLLDVVTHIRRQRSASVEVIAGNIVTEQGALAAIDAGANAILAGDQPTLNALGIGTGGFSALVDVVQAASMQQVPVLAGFSLPIPDRIKAFAAGASGMIFDTEEAATGFGDHLHKAMAATGCNNLQEFSSRTRFIRQAR